MDNRIYGNKVSVSEEETKAFWRNRASMYEKKGIRAVICGDQNEPLFTAGFSLVEETQMPIRTVSAASAL